MQVDHNTVDLKRSVQNEGTNENVSKLCVVFVCMNAHRTILESQVRCSESDHSIGTRADNNAIGLLLEMCFDGIFYLLYN